MGDSDICSNDRYVGFTAGTGADSDRLVNVQTLLGYISFTDDEFSFIIPGPIDIANQGPVITESYLINHLDYMNFDIESYRESYRAMELHNDRGFFMKGREDVLSITPNTNGHPAYTNLSWDMH